jgi:5-methylcytosine-specific restriction endonuclease McrA
MAGNTIGRSTRRFRRLAADLRAQRRPCCRCGQKIDYTLTHPDPGSFTVEHLKAWSTHPELREDPANLDAAHLGCNSSKGNSDGAPTLGSTSRAW